MKEEATDYLEIDTLRNLIKKYSQFITFPIYLWSSKVRSQLSSSFVNSRRVGPTCTYFVVDSIKCHRLENVGIACSLTNKRLEVVPDNTSTIVKSENTRDAKKLSMGDFFHLSYFPIWLPTLFSIIEIPIFMLFFFYCTHVYKTYNQSFFP